MTPPGIIFFPLEDKLSEVERFVKLISDKNPKLSYLSSLKKAGFLDVDFVKKISYYRLPRD